MKYLITGAAGQDGVIMSRKLLAKTDLVYGICKPSQSVYLRNAVPGINVVEFDLRDFSEIGPLLSTIKPDVIINLAGYSSVWKSWQTPSLVFEINTLIPIHILEWIRKYSPEVRFLQASSSEIFGNPSYFPQNEYSPLSPVTPYGASKAVVHEVIKQFRAKEGLKLSSAILYNHESPLRKTDFVSKHITHSVAKIKYGYLDFLEIGNIESSRDWGWAPDYVDGMISMLHQDFNADYIFASGKSNTVRDFIKASFREVGIENYENFIRPVNRNVRDVDPVHLVGDSSRARTDLDWSAETTFLQVVGKLMRFELQLLQNEKDEIWFE
jgi:GDPmannose 4,6-dehydratase